MRRSHTLTREERLRTRSEWKRVFASSFRAGVQGAKLVYRKNPLGHNRFAVSLVKKYGNAVDRNRTRRWGKEIFRLNKETIRTSFDFVVIFYPGEYGFNERRQQILELLEKARVLIHTPFQAD